jgi:DNA-binding NtrC family response regulator
MALILVVEDEPQVLVLAEAALKDAGYETLNAANFAGANALLQEGHRPDLLFVDHNLGKGPSGIDLARTARQHHPDIRVLYTSGEMLTDGVKAMFVERAEFLPKLYTPEQLLAAVKRLIGDAAPGAS